jgi:hypothetical protein
MKQPKGYDVGNNQTRIAVKLDIKLFKQITDQAKKENKSFSEMVSSLCKCGLLCLAESDALEPINAQGDELDQWHS